MKSLGPSHTHLWEPVHLSLVKFVESLILIYNQINSLSVIWSNRPGFGLDITTTEKSGRGSIVWVGAEEPNVFISTTVTINSTGSEHSYTGPITPKKLGILDNIYSNIGKLTSYLIPLISSTNLVRKNLTIRKEEENKWKSKRETKASLESCLWNSLGVPKFIHQMYDCQQKLRFSWSPRREHPVATVGEVKFILHPFWVFSWADIKQMNKRKAYTLYLIRLCMYMRVITGQWRHEEVGRSEGLYVRLNKEWEL